MYNFRVEDGANLTRLPPALFTVPEDLKVPVDAPDPHLPSFPIQTGEFERNDRDQRAVPLGETVLDSFWLAPGSRTVWATATIYNRSELWSDPSLALTAIVDDFSSQVRIYGGIGQYNSWTGKCKIHIDSEAVTLVKFSVRFWVGSGLVSDIRILGWPSD